GDSARHDTARALRDLIHGDDVVQTSKAFDLARRRFRKERQEKVTELPGVLALFHGLALLGAERLPDLDRLCRRARKGWPDPFDAGFAALHELANPPTEAQSFPPEDGSRTNWDDPNLTPWLHDDDPAADLDDDWPLEMSARRESSSVVDQHGFGDRSGTWDLWASLLVTYWQDGPCRHDGCVAAAERLRMAAKASGWQWLEGQCRHLAAALGGQQRAPRAMPAGLQVLTLSRYKPRWERSLDALTRATAAVEAKKAKAGRKGEAVERLTWRVAHYGHRLEIRAYLQKKTRGSWSKGRSISVSRLAKASDEP
ncbi:MAG: hypothetical protein DRI90_18215, partial [Deltaproteobacteria bacterium]